MLMAPDRTAVVSSRFQVIEGVLRLTAASLPGIERVHPIADRTQILDEIAEAHASIAVIDLDPGGTDAVDLVRNLSTADPRVLVVLLTDRVDGTIALEAMRSEVRGLLLKPDALRDLASTLRRILDGERIIDPALEASAVATLGRFAQRTREGSQMEATLSPRELEVLRLMGDGLTMRQIARRLEISPRTVETHATKLYRKLDVRTRVQAVSKAATIGLIELR
jgi:DNA-binding NarL/FixJ family response regulator